MYYNNRAFRIQYIISTVVLRKLIYNTKKKSDPFFNDFHVLRNPYPISRKMKSLPEILFFNVVMDQGHTSTSLRYSSVISQSIMFNTIIGRFHRVVNLKI